MACGKDNASNGQNGQPGQVTQPDQGGGTTSTQQFKESYRLIFNGCDTTKHEFFAADPDSVKKQLCDALQDDKLNNSCAEALRQNFFNKKCSGYAWNPRYENSNPPGSGGGSSQLPSSFHDYEKEQRIRDSLSNLLIEAYQLSPTVTGAEAVAVTQFMEDMKTCGLSYVGPKCVEYVTIRGQYVGSLYEVENDKLFVVELKIKGIAVPILFAFKMAMNGQSYSSTSLRVLKELKTLNGQAIKDYLADNTSAHEISSATLAANTLETAWKRIQKPADIREFYHLAESILDMSKLNPTDATNKKLAAVVDKNKELVTKSNNTEYQYRVLSLLADRISAPAVLLTSICDGMLGSPDPKLKQMAATYVLDGNPSREDVKRLVRQALSHERWDVRRRAVSGLSKAHPSLEDQKLIIAKIDDSDEDVRKSTIEVVDKFSLTTAHVDSLSQLLKSNNWDVRKNGARLLGKINDPKATAQVIGQMDDSDEDVRNEAFAQLNQKQLSSGMIPALSKNLTSNNWAVRRDTIKLVGKISGDQSTTILIKQIDDSDEDVRNQTVAELNKRNLADNMVAPLVEKFGSNNWAVRKSAAQFLGKISGSSATTALINQMNDSDEDVRKKIATQLQKRALSEDTVSPLKKQFGSNNWEVRKSTAKLLGKIKSQKALDALVVQLTVETDDDVKQQINASIAVIKN